MAVDVHAGGGGGQQMQPEGAAASWNDLEGRYFTDLKRKQQQEDDAHELEYARRSAALTVRLEGLHRDKASLEKRLRSVVEQTGSAQDELAQLHDEYQLHLSRVSLDRKAQYEHMHNHFQQQQQQQQTAEPIDIEFVNQVRAVGPTIRPPPLASPMKMVDEGDFTGAEVVDSDGDLIGRIRKIPAHNHWIDIMLDLDIKWRVVIRKGQKFTAANLDVIYEKTDAKCSKWIACMIQATGKVQAEPCIECQKGQGPFASCTKTPGNEFLKCGNCEWSRVGCQGAFASVENGAVDMPMADAGAPPQSFDPNSVNTIVTVHRPIAPAPIPGAGGPLASAPTPPAAYGAGGVGGMSTAANSPSPSDDAELTEQEREQLMSPNIIFRHDGRVYTYPDFVEGVPLEKIDQNHPYWDPNWKDPIEATKPVLASYEQKHADALRNDIKNTKFLLGRQVRRGQAILKFLEDGPISPYQIVSKKYMVPGIITYDTLFRLVNTVEELEKFKINVTPLDWLRHRLYELMLAQGDKFNLSKTVKDLYHDEKLGKLRKLSGFGNIGRPSGGKDATPRVKRKDGTGATPTRPYKRRSRIQQLAVPPAPAGYMYQPGGGQTLPKPYPTPAVTASREGHEDFEYDGCTDTDSMSGENVDKNDFKLLGLRTRRYKTQECPNMTQYWHNDADGFLDLQIWQHPSRNWVAYDPPVDFVADFGQIFEVVYHPDSLKVLLALRITEEQAKNPHSGGGEVMALLKRERTRRRLLSLFLQNDATFRIATSVEELENKWNELGEHAELLTDADLES